jgi:C1A family cysteine protease
MTDEIKHFDTEEVKNIEPEKIKQSNLEVNNIDSIKQSDPSEKNIEPVEIKQSNPVEIKQSDPVEIKHPDSEVKKIEPVEIKQSDHIEIKHPDSEVKLSSARKFTHGWKKPEIKKTYSQYKVKLPQLTLPISVDLRQQYTLPPCYDQGVLGSCTANAIAFCHQFLQIKQQNKYLFMPSRIFIYYLERVIENSVNFDNGALISSGISALVKTGVCDEKTCPYNINNFAVKPSSVAYTEASNFKLLSYTPINETLTDIKSALADGHPIAFGFQVYDSFESSTTSRTGIMTMPTKTETLLGGHAVTMVGYDDIRKVFIVRNSWGTSWGDNGHFYMPYEYVTSPNDYCDEFYATISVTNPVYPKVNPVIIKPKPKPTPHKPIRKINIPRLKINVKNTSQNKTTLIKYKQKLNVITKNN